MHSMAAIRGRRPHRSATCCTLSRHQAVWSYPTQARRSKMTYYLGFDNSCTACSDVGRVVSHESSGKVQATPLNSPIVSAAMNGWTDSEPEPVLVAVDDDDTVVGVWTGRRMGLKLASVIGFGSAHRIAAALRQKGPERHDHGASRRLALKGAAGGMASMAFFVLSPPAWGRSTAANLKASASPVDLGLEQVGGAAAQTILKSHLSESPDLHRVLTVKDIGAPSGITSLADAEEAFSVSSAEVTNQEISSRSSETHVAAAQATNSTDATLVTFVNITSGVYGISILSPNGIDGSTSMAKRYDFDASDPENPSFKFNSQSVNGELVEIFSSSTSAQENVEMAAKKCGPSCCANGPGGHGKKLSGECVKSSTWKCIRSIGGCAICGVPTSWLVGLGCAVVSCPSVVEECCASETTPTCKKCFCDVPPR